MIEKHEINDEELLLLDKTQNEIESLLDELEELCIGSNDANYLKKSIESISQIVWEQFIIQISGQAGEKFIRENKGLNLCLKKSEHILDPKLFKNGELPSHNFKYNEKYKQRFKLVQSNFKKDDNELVG